LEPIENTLIIWRTPKGGTMAAKKKPAPKAGKGKKKKKAKGPKA
jgi:hypothetical protein